VKRKGKAKFGIKWKNVYALVLIIAALIYAGKTYILPGKAEPSGEYGDIGTVVTEDPIASEKVNSASSNVSSDDILGDVPEYSGTPTYVLNGNKPEFTEDEYKRAKEGYIKLSELDYLGRCGPCEASLGKDMLDIAGERRDISGIYPTGWEQKSYPGIVNGEGAWLYHRSHLIAHMFAGADPEIDGEKNLITATEYCNEVGMLSYNERAVQNWLIRKADGDRILYRVTPVFQGLELVARGVHIEAGDVGSMGQKFHINVYCYNVEPGITIDYATGMSKENK